MINLPTDILNEISSHLDILSLRNLVLTGASINSVFQPVYSDYLEYINKTVKPKRRMKKLEIETCVINYDKSDLIQVHIEVAKVLRLPRFLCRSYGSYLYSLRCLLLWIKIYISKNSLMRNDENVYVDNTLSNITGIFPSIQKYTLIVENAFKTNKLPPFDTGNINLKQTEFLCSEYQELSEFYQKKF